MTTENENGSRTIEELLKLDSFQDMSDSEISSVIEINRQHAYMIGKAQALNDYMKDETDVLADYVKQLHDEHRRAIRERIAKPVVLETVAYQEQ